MLEYFKSVLFMSFWSITPSPCDISTRKVFIFSISFLSKILFPFPPRASLSKNLRNLLSGDLFSSLSRSLNFILLPSASIKSTCLPVRLIRTPYTLLISEHLIRNFRQLRHYIKFCKETFLRKCQKMLYYSIG